MKKLVFIVLLYFSPLLWGAVIVMLSAVEAPAQDQHLIDSLQRQLKNHNAHKLELGKNAPALYDTAKAAILNSLCKAFMDYNKAKATDYANQLLAISERMDYKTGMAKAFNSLGSIMEEKSDYAAALELYRKSLKIRDEIGDAKGVAGSYNNIGNIYLSQDNYPEALKYYFDALRLNEQSGNKEWQAFNLCNISSIYEKQGNLSEALSKLIAAGKLVDESGNMFLYPVYYLSIGIVYEKQGNNKEALNNYFKYMEACKKIDYPVGQSIASNHIGSIYLHQGNFAKALQLFLSALEIFKENGNDLDIAETCLNIGNTYSKQNNYAESLKYLNKALTLSKMIGSLGFVEQSYESLSELEKSKGNFAIALNYFKLSVTFRDSILNSENTKKSLGLQLQYDSEKKEKQISLLTKESKLQQTELQKQNTTRNLLIAACALIALLAGISYNRYRIKQKANVAIEKTMQYLKTTQEQLVEHEKLASLGKFTSDVAREIEVPVKHINELNKVNRTLIQNIKNANSIADAEALKNNLLHIFNYGKEADAVVKKVLTETRKVQG